MPTAITSSDLIKKSVHAALSAIELYNKPDFRYREESFAILMCNAWELLLKAKTLRDNGENLSFIVETKRVRNKKSGGRREIPKTNRSGNAMTLGIWFLATKMFDAKVNGLSKECVSNIALLIEVRDNAIHFVNPDLELSQKVLEIGTASLKNYMHLAAKWFGVDFSVYNFFLMPISFFHGFETVSASSASSVNEQTKRFLDYLASVPGESPEDSEHNVLLTIETRVVKGKGSDGVPVRWSNDPSLPAMTVREEDLLERYPYDAADLIQKMRDRYTGFKQDSRYYKLKKPLESDEKYCKIRYLDPKNPRSGSKKFFSTEVFKVFDLHYEKRAAV